MSLDEHIPKIDDRRYDDIIAEVRTRIARYTPEWTPVWTDLNDSDPGITLAQLFAWQTDMLLYRMAKVPELNYLKFLQLLGIELKPAEPALTEITFMVKEDHPSQSIIVPARTQVSAESPDDGPPLIFETDRALFALKAKLTSLQAFDGYTFTDLSEENDKAVNSYQPFGSLAGDGAALYLGFFIKEKTEVFPQIELDLALWTSQQEGQAVSLKCGLPDTPVYGPARLRWQYWNGSEWLSLKFLKDDTNAFTRSGHILLKTPAKDAMQRSVIGEIKEELYWIRALIEHSQYERPPKLLAIRTNTVTARQAETIVDEVLGGSSGRRNQVFRLASFPVLADSLHLEVDEGDAYQAWTRVDDFLASSSEDLHFALNRTTGEIRFGDGLNGHIPVANPNNPDANIVARLYRIGGGKRGNVPAQAIKTLVTSIDGIDDNGVGNLQAAHNGRDEESLTEAKKRAPRAIKSRCRAVTAEDYEHLAMQAANVKRAKALTLFHPDFPGVKVPGVVTVIVVPDADVPNPMPSEGTLRTVCAYLDQRRLLTTELYVIKPTYQQVEVQGEVIVNGNADLAEVNERIEKTLLDYLHPLKGGEDGLGWPFGGTIYYSRVYQHVFTVPGVQSIQRLVIVLDGEQQEECRDIPIQDDALVYSTQHNIQVQYSFDE
ncbi:MAG: putative baseplate assembly protein [Methylococcales bacterium]|nr:putative baseplate assembly protein [Methylococcales bacterium]